MLAVVFRCERFHNYVFVTRFIFRPQATGDDHQKEPIRRTYPTLENATPSAAVRFLTLLQTGNRDVDSGCAFPPAIRLQRTYHP